MRFSYHEPKEWISRGADCRRAFSQPRRCPQPGPTETVNIPELETLATGFLQSIGYSGLAEVEFMYDPKHARFELLEVNPRIWGWHTIAIRAGVDLPYLVYADAVGEEIAPGPFREGVKWVRGSAGGGQILGIRVVTPQLFQATTGNDGRPYVQIQPTVPVDNMRFIHILYPTDDVSWNTKPTVLSVDDNGNVAAVRVQMNDGSGRSDDVLLTYSQPTSTTGVGAYAYDGQSAVITRGADGSLEKLFLDDGTFVKDQKQGKVLVSGLGGDVPFEVSYSDRTAAVYGRIRTAVTLYAPQVERLTINGLPSPFARSGDNITFRSQSLTDLPLIIKGGS